MDREADEVFPDLAGVSDTARMKSVRARAPLLRPAAQILRPRTKRSDSLACRTLLSVARQRKQLDAGRCQIVFEHLDTALAIHAALHRTLAKHRLSDLQFAVLVALFALDPEPVTPADLANYTAVSRAAITDALVRLESLELVSRTRSTSDRRVYYLQLTVRGRSTLEGALVRYLSAVGGIARHIDDTSQPELLRAYDRLQRGAAEIHPHLSARP
jgi:DNA-binding MarR family transcriptional regulator